MTAVCYNTSMKTRDVNFSVKQQSQIDYIVNHLKKNYPQGDPVRWGFIIHNKDTKDGQPVDDHLHVAIEFTNPRSIESIADEFCIPSHMIEKTRSKRAIFRYLVHRDNPEKSQYSITDITANFNYSSYFLDKVDEMEKVVEAWKDYKALRKGEITANEYIQRRQIYLGKLTELQLLQFFVNVSKVESALGLVYKCRVQSSNHNQKEEDL